MRRLGYTAIRKKAAWPVIRNGKRTISTKRVPSWKVGSGGEKFVTCNAQNMTPEQMKMCEDIESLKQATPEEWAEFRKEVRKGNATPEEYELAEALARDDFDEAQKQIEILQNKPWHYGLSGKQFGRALYLTGTTQRAETDFPNKERRELDYIIRRADSGY